MAQVPLTLPAPSEGTGEMKFPLSGYGDVNLLMNSLVIDRDKLGKAEGLKTRIF